MLLMWVRISDEVPDPPEPLPTRNLRVLIESASAISANCRRAAGHYCGKGLEHGADLRAVTLFIAALKRWHRPHDANIMGVITAGGSWQLSRVHEAYPDIPDVCARCGHVGDTPYHRHYGCAHNTPDTPKVAAEFSALKQAALAGHE